MYRLGVVLLLCAVFAGVAHGDGEKDVDCWRGDKCQSCSNVGSQNGVSVCCPACFVTGFKIIGGDKCTCFMVPPSGGTAVRQTCSLFMMTLPFLCVLKILA